LIHLVRNIKKKAIISLNEKNKKYKFMKKCYPFLIKIVKNLKNKAYVSLYEK